MADKNAFTTHQLYIMESVETNHPFVDENGASHVYIHQNDAEENAKQETKNGNTTRVSDPKFYSIKTLGELCYAAGADAMVVHSGDTKDCFPIREQDLPIACYNHNLCKTLAFIKQYKQRKYLEYLALCEFIVPVQIRMQEDDVKIVYCVAKHSQSEVGQLYLAFSNLAEFTIWASDNPNWHPVKMHYKRLRGICGTDGIMINPGGNRLVLSPAVLRGMDIAIAHKKTSTKTKSENQKPEQANSKK